jgi:hypothetical protein
MHSALTDLALDHLIIIYPGDKVFLLAEKITVCGLELITRNEFNKILEDLLKK